MNGDLARYRPLSEEDINDIHLTSLRVLAEVGVKIPDRKTGEILEEAGATVEADGDTARIPGEAVMRAIERAPSSITLCGLNPDKDIVLRDGNVYFGTGGTALNMLDAGDASRRSANLKDLVDVSRLVDGLDNIDFLLLPTYPNDLAVEDVDVNRFFAGLLYTGKHVMGGVYTEDGVDKVISMARDIAGSPQELRRRPIISIITCMISPLKPDKNYTAMMTRIAREGIPVAVPAEPLCGATGPVTLAGNLVMQNVDSLTGVVIVQTVNPGTPVLYGSVASSTDLRTMKYLCGSVEMGLLNAAGAQMARFYGLPYYATAGATDSKTLDVQSAYESSVTALLTALAGAHYIHDAAGLMEFAMTACLEKYVIDNEILGMVRRAIEGIRVDENTLAFEVIRKVGAGGDFISRSHTRKNMRREHYLPQLSDRRDREDWEADGGKDAVQRAGEKVAEILDCEGRTYLPWDTVRSLKSRFPEIVI
ncbi:MAG: trimethylamine methyltransferase family protein [Actinomycetota bacterium]|nr:trimethylamine methyltransferase family protein [Actinomycetota bacterium]